VVRVDGRAGTVELEGVEEVQVVTSFLEDAEGRVLLLRRSSRVGSFQGRWAGVSGFLEDPTPEAQARREIAEETGFRSEEIHLERRAAPIYARDGHRIFVVHPFRFRVKRGTVKLDWEHTDYEWVAPSAIGKRTTVPKLLEVWNAVAPRRSRTTRRNR
jgi:8-oxo-dGTP pyrophosphatase MutT (NUDIX family)